MLESLIISAGVPIVLDLVKSAGGAISRKWLGLSVDDQIKIDNAQVGRMEALAKLDNPYGTPSQWVVDLRGSFRYIFSGLLVVTGGILAGYGASKDFTDFIEAGLQLATSPLGFILGERLVLSFKR